MKKIILPLLLALLGSAVLAKLPAASDEAKAKAAEAAAKTAWAGKVDGYQLCQAQNKVAARTVKAAAKDPKAVATPLPPCADPGPFVYPPPVAASAPAAVPAKKP
jgi:type II secretory pathway pseudopilin PulG